MPGSKDKPRFSGSIMATNIRSELDCSNTKSKRVHCQASNTSVNCCVRTKEFALEVRPPLIESLMKNCWYLVRQTYKIFFSGFPVSLSSRGGLDCSNAKKQTSALLSIEHRCDLSRSNKGICFENCNHKQ
jgi:hypothetical protein